MEYCSNTPSLPLTDGDGKVPTIHRDILQTHILARLDGPTLTAAGCVSSDLHELAVDQKLWEKICNSTWPSISDPRVSQVISTFRSGYRSFFSDSYPLVHYSRHQPNLEERSFPATSELITAVDIYYKNIPIFSKVVETEVDDWFLCSPLRLDLLEAKEFVHPWMQQEAGKDLWLKELEENVTLSWILIDPKRKRAVNLSSHRPVMAQRHWLTGEVQLKFAIVMAGDGRGRWLGSEKECVECGMVITCGGKEGKEVRVREVCMGMEDMDGGGLSGKDSLAILQGTMESGERRRRVSREEGKERFKEFLGRKIEWKVMKKRKEKALDLLSIVVGVSIVLVFWLWLFGPFF